MKYINPPTIPKKSKNDTTVDLETNKPKTNNTVVVLTIISLALFILLCIVISSTF